MNPPEVLSTEVVLSPDPRRVLLLPFIPSNIRLLQNMVDRALALSEEDVMKQLTLLRKDFLARHLDLEACWLRHFQMIRHMIELAPLSPDRELFMGALFSSEYALESAALFNPCMVPHPDQTRVGKGDLRFVMSLRATGEGHISSIEFRSGVIHHDGRVAIDEAPQQITVPEVKENPTYCKGVFELKLMEMGFENFCSQIIMTSLGEEFTHAQLAAVLQETVKREDCQGREVEQTIECIEWLARSNYEVHFKPVTTLSQRVIFPVSPNECKGIEDARFVKLTEENGDSCYYATYTAYNGLAILPQLIETPDFENFRVLTLNGQAAQNKGMALFPRRVAGRYMMISRQDDENLFLMASDNLHFWNDPRPLATPDFPWQFVKIGNCGSPIETEAGWLLLTHGVGPMRRYCIGAMLLDLQNPAKVIGVLKEPLLEPIGEKREGYVPNVVYSCGGLVHNGRLIIPYALSDTRSTIGTINLDHLLAALISNADSKAPSTATAEN